MGMWVTRGTGVRKLNWDLRQLMEEHKEGSFSTRRDRSYVLNKAANDLHQLGYKGLRATGIRRKHVAALVREWQRQELSTGTLKNRVACLRWWSERVGKPGVVPEGNAALGIERRVYVTNEDRSRDLDAERLARVTDEHVRMSLRLQAEFGLRREESIKFQASYADRGDRIVLKATWTKGGRPREVPIRNEEQRAVLDAARKLAGGGALIRADRNYRQQRDAYVWQTKKVGFDHMHGLRHAYAQRRYREEMGRECPALGGPGRRLLRGGEREADREVRETISAELGHGRIEVVAVYLGS